MLENIFFLSFAIIGINWFFLGVYEKTGLKELASIYAPNKYYSKLFNCDFCLSIRFSSICLIIYFLNQEFEACFLFVPLIVAGITYKINL